MKYIIGSDSVTVFLKGNSYTINKQAHTYPSVIKAIKEDDEDALEAAINVRQSIVEGLSKSSKDVRIEGTQIFYGDREVTGLVASRIFEIIRLGLDTSPMVRFIENLMQNPSKRAVDELFGFLDACSLPLTEDGHFLAYKRVRADYKDVHSGTMDNSVGKIVEMERNLVDEDKNNTCSYGLHFCSYDYLRHFSGERIMVLKINPKDVVAIPADYNNSKGRTCRYEVVDELPVNEYRMPERTIQEGYTTEYSVFDIEEEDEDTWDVHDEVPFIETIPYSPSSKLCEDDVRDIRWLLSKGESVSKVAQLFYISERQVRRIRDGQAWKNVV